MFGKVGYVLKVLRGMSELSRRTSRLGEQSSQLSDAGKKMGMEDETRYWSRWSHNAKLATIIIFSVLGVLTVVFGLIYYNPPAPSNSDTICPAFGLGPCRPRETLSLQSSQTNSPTNMTLQLKNTSAWNIAICSYTVHNSTGQQNQNSTTACVPSMAPGTITSLNIVIDAKIFTFNSGSTYTIVLLTARNDLIQFTVVA